MYQSKLNDTIVNDCWINIDFFLHCVEQATISKTLWKYQQDKQKIDKVLNFANSISLVDKLV